jgi:hypothetical protein
MCAYAVLNASFGIQAETVNLRSSVQKKIYLSGIAHRHHIAQFFDMACES